MDEVAHRRRSDEHWWPDVQVELKTKSCGDTIDRIEGGVDTTSLDPGQVRRRDASGRGHCFEGEAESRTNVAACSSECHTDAFWIGHAASQAGAPYLGLNPIPPDLTSQSDS
jgi:hypothetical protein